MGPTYQSSDTEAEIDPRQGDMLNVLDGSDGYPKSPAPDDDREKAELDAPMHDEEDIPEVTDEVEVPEGPERLWAAREDLTRLHQFARARRVSPWAALGVVLLRALATVPPNMALPATVGGRASVNSFLALVGSSGAGKDTAMKAARAAVALPIASPSIPVKPLGSGEGLVKAFASRAMEEVDGERAPVTRIHDPVVMFETSEVDQLRAQGERSGATLMPQLRSAYSGGQLGSTYAAVDKAVILEEGEYRMMLVVGVQPRRSDALLGDEDGGTPQRFIWLPTLDPGAVRDAVEPTPWRMPDPKWPTGGGTIAIPAEAREEIIDKRIAVLHGKGNPLDGHEMLTRLKVAAAFAVLDGRQKVNRDDWRLSRIVMIKSHETRQECLDELEKAEAERDQKRGRSDGLRQIARDQTVAESGVERIARLVVKRVRSNGNSITHGDLNRSLTSRDRPFLPEAIEIAIKTGNIERSGEELTYVGDE